MARGNQDYLILRGGKNVDEHVKGFDNLICSVNINLMFYGMISNNFSTKLSILEYKFPDFFFVIFAWQPKELHDVKMHISCLLSMQSRYSQSCDKATLHEAENIEVTC